MDYTLMEVDATTQFIALIVQGIGALLLALIAYVARKGYFIIRDSLKKLEDVSERIATLEENDAKRAKDYQGVRDELFYLKGVIGSPMDQPASAALKEARS